MTISLSEFLCLENVKKGIQRMARNNFDHVKIRFEDIEDKILLTSHDLTGCVSSRGFKIEKITNTIFAVLPKEISLIKN